jgi:MFS family permease
MAGFFQDRSTKLSFAWLINSLAYSIVYPFLPIYLHNSRGIPMAQVGLIFPLMGLGVIAGPPISGYLVDKLGRRLMLIGGPAVRGILFLILALLALLDAPFYMFALTLTASACVGTFFQNASDAYLTDMTTPKERPKVYSRIRVGTNIGWAIGPMLGAFLARTPFSLLFALTAVLCFAGSIFVMMTCPEIKKAPVEVVQSESTGPSGKFNWSQFFHNYRCVLTLFFGFMLYLLVSQLFSVFSVFSTSILGITKNQLGFVYSINGLTIVLLQIPVTHILDRKNWELDYRLVLGAFMYFIGFFVVAFCSQYYHLMGAVALLTTGEVITQPALYTVISRMAPAESIGRYMGILGLVRGTGYALGPYIGSLLFPHYSHNALLFWGILSSFGLTAAIGFLVLGIYSQRHPEKTKNLS